MCVQEPVRVCRFLQTLHTHDCIFPMVCMCDLDCILCFKGGFLHHIFLILQISFQLLELKSAHLYIWWFLLLICQMYTLIQHLPQNYNQWNHHWVLLWFDLIVGVTWSIFMTQSFPHVNWQWYIFTKWNQFCSCLIWWLIILEVFYNLYP